MHHRRARPDIEVRSGAEIAPHLAQRGTARERERETHNRSRRHDKQVSSHELSFPYLGVPQKNTWATGRDIPCRTPALVRANWFSWFFEFLRRHSQTVNEQCA
jgi:hypothetical protein